MDFSSPVTSALLNSITGVQPQSVVKEVKCEVCNILVSSYVVLVDHRAGRKHKNQLKLLVRNKKINLNCVICGVLSKTNDEWELHVTSERHVENAKRCNPVPAMIPPPTLDAALMNRPLGHPIVQQPLKPPSNIPPLLPPTELLALTAQIEEKLNQKALKQIVAKDKKEWNCSHCKVTCQSLCSWEAHLSSHKHRKNRHKFHTYPGISKEFVKRKYQNSFVRAAETFGNEFIEDGVVFYCKRCDVRMENKLQLEVHMSSNQHKMNHPITPIPVVDPAPVRNTEQLFNFEYSAYGYGFRNWNGEQQQQTRFEPPASQLEMQQRNEAERQRQLVEQAKTELLARFPFYAINLQNTCQQEQSSLFPDNIPMPVEAPQPVAAPAIYDPFTPGGN